MRIVLQPLEAEAAAVVQTELVRVGEAVHLEHVFRHLGQTQLELRVRGERLDGPLRLLLPIELVARDSCAVRRPSSGR